MSVEAPCGVNPGDLIQPGEKSGPYNCSAVHLVPMTGLGFSHEVGLPLDQRTLKVREISSNCLAFQRNGQCPQGYTLTEE